MLKKRTLKTINSAKRFEFRWTKTWVLQTTGRWRRKGKNDMWNGNEWNVALMANEYGITDIESCMTVACSPYVDCVGVSWHNTPYCYVWDNCDFDNLIGGKDYVSLKKNCKFTLNINIYLEMLESIA